MSTILQVHLLPDLTTPERLADSTVVVIDVLRATTTILEALAAGARQVIPCSEVDEARRIAAERPGAVLGGERAGLPIEGFHLGNSPAEYTFGSVGGKTLVFTTTNGTRAMMRCRQAERVLLAAFANLSAVGDALVGRDRVHLVCAGTDGEITQEDVLLAGAIVNRLAVATGDAVELNDSARLARAFWQSQAGQGTAEQVAAVLAESRGGRNLTRLGLAADIADAARIDRHQFVPRLDISTWRIAGQPGE